MEKANSLLLRLSGVQQAWNTEASLRVRRTNTHPTKSGVLGMLRCAMGTPRDKYLPELNSLTMGVRVDRKGTLGWDYQTVSEVWTAEGKLKKDHGEQSTFEINRQYLFGASFLVALIGPEALIAQCGEAVRNPTWPMYLGRKNCIPGEQIYLFEGSFQSLSDALSSVPWHYGRKELVPPRRLDAYVEDSSGELVLDVPIHTGVYAPRYVRKISLLYVEPPEQEPMPKEEREGSRSSHFINIARKARLTLDGYACVFCQATATEVHHVNYLNCGKETNDDLRSLCWLCHAACTRLEYDAGMKANRIDPCDPSNRNALLEQIYLIIAGR